MCEDKGGRVPTWTLLALPFVPVKGLVCIPFLLVVWCGYVGATLLYTISPATLLESVHWRSSVQDRDYKGGGGLLEGGLIEQWNNHINVYPHNHLVERNLVRQPVARHFSLQTLCFFPGPNAS